MEFSYGQGEYIEGKQRYAGKIVLSEHKLFLKSGNEDLPQTYIPLEKIKRIRKVKGGIEIFISSNLYIQFMALMTGEHQYISELVTDLVSRRGLKKQFLKNEWAESQH